MADPDATGSIADKETGWSFNAVLEEPGAGYVVGDLKHDGHLCAIQMKVERILVASHSATGTRDPLAFENFTLGSTRLKRVKGPLLHFFGKNATDRRGFYNPRLGVSTHYKLENVFGEPGQEMHIAHELLFTPYSKDPSHEPGGILRAARVYPMIGFNAPPPVAGQKLKNPNLRIAAVRVLYKLRFHVWGDKLENQAGIFRDLEEAGTLDSVKGVKGKGPGALIFERAEKPLISEVVGRGVIRRSNVAQLAGDRVGWDNIHQWNAAFKDPKEFMDAAKNDGFASTPGLPYGVHQHWRWAAVYYKGLTGRFAGGAHFGGLGGAGGPMIDPNLPDQLMEFGITQAGLREQHVEQLLNNSRRMTFDYPLERLLAERSEEPENISLGKGLTTWMDVTAYSRHINEAAPFTRSNTDIFGGNLFVHGVFFAHEDIDVLPTYLGLPLPPGSRKPQYLPYQPTPSDWRRPSGR